jgi:hypothetical protein
VNTRRKNTASASDVALADVVSAHMNSQPTLSTNGRAPRHPAGRGSEMTAAEIEQVRLDFLCHSLNRVQLSEKYGRTRNTIARCLDGKEFEELRRQVDGEVREVVRRRMVAKADGAVDHWERSMGVAADRGDHKPSKDWLMHAGVVDPVDSTESGPKVIVQIGVSAAEVKVGIGAPNGSVNVGVVNGAN